MKRSLILSFVTVSTARAASILYNARVTLAGAAFPREQAAPLSASSNRASHPVRRRKKGVEVRRPEAWLSGSLDQTLFHLYLKRLLMSAQMFPYMGVSAFDFLLCTLVLKENQKAKKEDRKTLSFCGEGSLI